MGDNKFCRIVCFSIFYFYRLKKPLCFNKSSISCYLTPLPYHTHFWNFKFCKFCNFVHYLCKWMIDQVIEFSLESHISDYLLALIGRRDIGF